ncbi:carboxyvinyl-carboxyphosphonate phosphorylmutase [Nocardioidaceae bacterium Broad-1]|nr:carboxyvinyl-carboxyphosphonate phosphorylmutase [Nocardioidaceae bacterium Broad-1]
MNPNPLRALLERPGLVVAPGVYDGLTAALVEAAGFDAAYMSGAAVSASAVGLPDIGLATMTELVAQTRVINRQLTIPLVADADTGFGDVTNVYRTVQEYREAGVAAIQLEDQVFPKRCGHLEDKELVDVGEFKEKIQSAVEARGEDGMLIIARTDARATFGLDEAIARGRAYAEAGADLLFVEAPQTIEEIRAIPTGFDIPTVFNVVPRGKTPPVTLTQLSEFGYGMAIVPAVCISTALTAMSRALTQLRNGDLDTTGQASPRELFDTLGLPSWENLRSKFPGVPSNA